MGGIGENTAIEITNTLVTSAGALGVGVHGVEETTNQIETVSRGFTCINKSSKEIAWEQANVFCKEGDKGLKDKPLGKRTIHVASNEFFEAFREFIGSSTGDGFTIIAKLGGAHWWGTGKQGGPIWWRVR